MKTTINIDGITLTATMTKKGEGTTGAFNLMHTKYRVILSVSGRECSFTFHDSHANWQKGAGASKQLIYDALDCYISDAYAYLNSRDFNDFCNEYGYDMETDLKTAKMTFEGCHKAYQNLTKLLVWDDIEKLSEIVRGES